MNPLQEVFGEVKKLTFEGYLDNTFAKGKLAGTFSVQYNPATFSNSFQISREDKKTSETDTSPIYKYTTLPEVIIEFTIDATGVDTNVFNSFRKKTIKQQIDDFLKIVHDVDSSTHEPHFVKIIYGELSYKTVLKSCDITYTLFKADGTPLRAKLNSKFQCIQNSKEYARKLSLESPDVTHKRILKEHQNLVAMSNDIYLRNDLYQEVAQFNQLNSFRRVPTGTALFFPPIEK